MAPEQMTYRERKALSHLKDVADQYAPTNPVRRPYWHSLTRRVDLSAQDLTRLVKKFSKASGGNERRIRSFSRHYGADSAVDLNTLQPREIQQLLQEYMNRIDKLLFFKLMRRNVNKRGSSSRARPLTKVTVKDTERRNTLGQWDPRENTVNIWLRGATPSGMNGGRRNLEELLATLAHEMVHGFLDIFADELEDAHNSWVETDGGHGHVFLDLHHFVMKSMCSWISAPTPFLTQARNRAKQEWQASRQGKEV